MELDVMKELIKKYEPGHSAFMLKAATGIKYYCNMTDILFSDPSTDEDGNPLRNADNRIPRNFHGLIVNQKAAYAFTAPPLFDVGSTASNKQITKMLGDEYAKNCMELCINAANTSVGWIHYWIDDEGFQWAVVKSEEIVPVWDKSLKRKLIGVMRSYSQLDEDTGVSYQVYEYWNEKECEAFRRMTDSTVDTGLDYFNMFSDPSTDEMTAGYNHGFGEVPFIPFFNNNIHTSDLGNIKPLIDVYDKVYSGFINDLEDIQELIFVLSGYGGTELNGFLSDLKKYKTIKLDAGEGNAGVSTLSIEIPIEARKTVLEVTRKAIFEQGQGFDPQPESFGNQSGEALKFMYSLLEMKTGLMETEFRLGFAKLVRAICKYINISCDAIIQTWTRTCIKNETEQAQICKDSVGIVSRKTILKNHPFVEDADEELREIEAQEEKEMKKYADYSAQGENTSGGDE